MNEFSGYGNANFPGTPQAGPAIQADDLFGASPAAAASIPEQQVAFDTAPAAAAMPQGGFAGAAFTEAAAAPQAIFGDAAYAAEPAAPLQELAAEPAQAPEQEAPRVALESFFTSSPTSAAYEDVDPEDAPADDSSRAFMQNRELSWLTFDERVLDQGADESVPLLERLNFISIFWSNLQEFFMVRVGSLTDLSYIEPPVRDSKTGMTPKEQIKAIHERCRELYPIQESYYEHVRGQLAKQGVRHLRPDDLSDEQRNYLAGMVKYNIEPFLSPQIINPRHPFPHLENGKLYILVRLDDEAAEEEKRKKAKKGKKGKGGADGVVLGLIPLPHQCDRIIKLPGRGFQFILLEHAIEMFAADIFSMYKIKHTNVICVTRNADIDANQAGDEQDEDYREHMKRLLKQRARLAPVRLECERPLSPVMAKHMLKKLGLKKSQVYDTTVPLDLSWTWGLGGHLSDEKRSKLSNPPFTPAWPAAFDKKRKIIDQVSEKEVLLSYPFESMDPFVQLLKEAAFDPDVVSIKITLYRLASQSQLAEALITAAENGKQVTALFELRARFDESNNIEWSQRFEQAGCNVIYGFRDYKVHSKICCITRRLPDGSLQYITQLGTGNYNEKTAKLYTDLSFITTDPAFGRDATEFFKNMQLENVSDNYEVLRVAPLQIKAAILENLDRQIARAQAGLPSGAFLKANSVTDKEVIEKIAEASQAGVGITLFVRGICCLVPEVKGKTDNVRVVSIVGRLLEHSRIYCFGTPDDCTIYLSSADLMTRNLSKRVEIAWPIQSAAIRARILEYIDVCLHDTAKLRELRPNLSYTPLGAFCDLDDEGNSQPAFDAQAALIARAAAADPTAPEATAKPEPAGKGQGAAPAHAARYGAHGEIAGAHAAGAAAEAGFADVAAGPADGAAMQAGQVGQFEQPAAQPIAQPVIMPLEQQPAAQTAVMPLEQQPAAQPATPVDQPAFIGQPAFAEPQPESGETLGQPAVAAETSQEEAPDSAEAQEIAPAAEPVLTEMSLDDILSPLPGEAPALHPMGAPDETLQAQSMEPQPAAFQAQPQSAAFQALPIEPQPAFESQPASFQAQPMVFQAQPMEPQPAAFQPQPMDPQPAFEPQLQPMGFQPQQANAQQAYVPAQYASPQANTAAQGYAFVDLQAPGAAQTQQMPSAAMPQQAADPVQTQQQAQPQQQQAQPQQQQAQPDFFAEKHREMDIPQKKPGLFSRFKKQ